MKITINVADHKKAFFLELLKNFNDFITIEDSSNPSESSVKIEDNLKKITSFQTLASNWNYNGAVAINEKVVKKTMDLVQKLPMQPEIFPTARQSIQLEYEKKDGDYLEFEVFENQIICLSEIASTQQEFEVNDISKINKLIKIFYA